MIFKKELYLEKNKTGNELIDNILENLEWVNYCNNKRAKKRRSNTRRKCLEDDCYVIKIHYFGIKEIVIKEEWCI